MANRIGCGGLIGPDFRFLLWGHVHPGSTQQASLVVAMEGHSAGIVMSCNECINRRDLGGLSRLMTDDHVFIDSGNSTISGKERCVEAALR
jgi:hypothetical protein